MTHAISHSNELGARHADGVPRHRSATSHAAARSGPGYGRFVGRVGGLAVALGVGAAIASNPGIAAAETGATTSPTGSASATDTNSPQPAQRLSKVKVGTRATGNAADVKEGLSQVAAQGRHAASRLSSEARAAASDVAKRLREAGKGTTPDNDSRDRPQAESRAGRHAAPDPVADATQAAREIGDRLSGLGATTLGVRDVTPATVSTYVQNVKAAYAAPGVMNVPTALAEAGAELRSKVISAAELIPRPASPTTPPEAPALWSLLGWASREIGGTSARTDQAAASTNSAALAATPTEISPLATPEQIAIEQRAAEIVKSPLVQGTKILMKAVFRVTAEMQFKDVGGVDQANLDQLDAAIDAWALFAAEEAQNQNPTDPQILTILLAEHNWYGINVGDTRNSYDNPDTIYRFIPMSSQSSYVITGHFDDDPPADFNISVLTGLGGGTASTLSIDDLVVDADGNFTITLDSNPTEPGQTNHIQLPSDTSGVIVRDTLSEWDTQTPATLSVTRTSGPSNSIFAQLGFSQIPGIGPKLVEVGGQLADIGLFGPVQLPDGVVAAQTSLIMVVGALNYATRWGQLVTTDAATGELNPPNVLSQPASAGSDTLETQLQSLGYFQLEDDQALVVTVQPNRAGYFVVPVTNDWGVTQNYWNEQTSLNSSQAVPNPDGSYTFVISKTDPGVANWVSTGGLNQGTLFVRFQDLDPTSTDNPTVTSQVVDIDDLDTVLPATTEYVTPAERQDQIDARKYGFERRFGPYPQL